MDHQLVEAVLVLASIGQLMLMCAAGTTYSFIHYSGTFTIGKGTDVTWNNVNSYCKGRGKALCIIADSTKLDQVKTFLNSMVSRSNYQDIDDKFNILIGLRKADEAWKWVDETPLEQPNPLDITYDPETDECGSIKYDGSVVKFEAVPCDGVETFFICEPKSTAAAATAAAATTAMMTTVTTEYVATSDDFELVTTFLSWKKARTQCEGEGKQLCAANSASRRDEMAAKLGRSTASAWIGLYEEADKWKWTDGTETSPNSETSFLPNKVTPDHCGQIKVQFRSDDEWTASIVSDNCDGAAAFLCCKSFEPTTLPQPSGRNAVPGDVDLPGEMSIPDKQSSWFNATAFCENEGMKLYNAKNELRLSELKKKLEMPEKRSNSVWIGLHVVNEQWQWVDGTVMSSSTPGFQYSASPDLCGTAKLTSPNGEMELGASTCNSQLSFVCEKVASAAPVHDGGNPVWPGLELKGMFSDGNEPRDYPDEDLMRNFTESPCRNRTWSYSNKTGYCYLYQSFLGDWNASDHLCRYVSHNVTLLAILDDEEQEFVEKQLMPFVYEDHWLGAYVGSTNEGAVLGFQYQSGERFPDHPRWGPGEPIIGSNRCVYISRLDKMNLKWYWKTAKCSEKKMIYCQEKARRCPPVPSAPNLIPSSYKPNIEPNITFRCAPGYYMPDYEALYEEWMESVNNGSSNDTKPAITENPTLHIMCDYSAKWTNTSIAVAPCVPVACDPVPNITYAVHNGSSASILRYPSYVRYTCKHGYYFSGVESRHMDAYCAPNKKWITDYWGLYPKKCDPVMCESLIPPKNTTAYNRRNTYFNQIVAFRCDTGMMFPDGNVWKFSVCRQNFVNEVIGRWNDTDLKDCENIECPLPPDPMYTVREGGENLTYLANVTYTCLDGYEFPDSSTEVVTFCTKDARWSPRVRACIAIPETKMRIVGRRYKPEPVDAPEAKSIGSSAAIILIIMAGLVVLLDMSSLRRDLRRMQRNLRHFKRMYTSPK